MSRKNCIWRRAGCTVGEYVGDDGQGETESVVAQSHVEEIDEVGD